MTRKQEYDGLIWVDLEAPTEAEIKQITADYRLHPLAAAELALPSSRSKVDFYTDFIYLILHFPVCNLCYGVRSSTDHDAEEVDFIIGKNYLVTVHYQPVEVLVEFLKTFTTSRLSDSGDKIHAGYLFYFLIKHLYNSLTIELDYTNSVLKQAERQIFADEQRATVQLLADINRNLLDFRWALKTHRPALDSLLVAGREFFGDHFKYYLAAIAGEYEKVWNMLENNRDTFLDLRQTNESLLSIKTNETIKLLTVLAFIFLPITIVVQFFGMNTNLPLVGPPRDYLAVLGLMVLVMAVMLTWARYRRWL
ncbi:MAG: hypothetical protein HYT47_00855 [Candidatus Vogelbacteria bacterium]|nr:hypothetical protein [Candidatus Vogelbacteria bacterium]